MTVREALKRYYFNFDYWLMSSGGDVKKVNAHMTGTPEFKHIDEAVVYSHKLGELIENLDWEMEKELKNAY